MHQENNQRHRYLSGDELRSFLTALDAEPSPSLADALRFLLMTGARRGEVLQARWDAIDLDKQQWYLPQTKNGKSRFVLLNDVAVELLRQRPRTEGNVYVFPAKTGLPIVNPYKGFQRVRRAQQYGKQFEEPVVQDAPGRNGTSCHFLSFAVL